MNPQIIALLMFVMPFISFGQHYHQILTKDKFFDVSSNSTSICNYDYAARYFINGDTIINGLQYKVLYAYSFISDFVPYCPPFKILKIPYNSGIFMREDTILKKVYVLFDKQDDSEFLLYDFNMNVGDSLMTRLGDYVKLVSIEPVTLEDGSQRLQYNLHNHGYFIEGIGGDKGVFNDFGIGPGWWRNAMCILQDGKKIYGDDCSSRFVQISETEIDEIKIFPNPIFDDLLYIHGNYTIVNIVISEISGKVLINTELAQSKTLDIKSLSSGIYLIKITDKHTSRLLKNSKIIVNH